MNEPLPEDEKVAKALGRTSVYPVDARKSDYGEILDYPQPGITKRELFAAMAMQGLLSNWEALARMGFKAHEIEKFAIERTDALLKELAK